MAWQGEIKNWRWSYSKRPIVIILEQVHTHSSHSFVLVILSHLHWPCPKAITIPSRKKILPARSLLMIRNYNLALQMSLNKQGFKARNFRKQVAYLNGWIFQISSVPHPNFIDPKFFSLSLWRNLHLLATWYQKQSKWNSDPPLKHGRGQDNSSFPPTGIHSSRRVKLLHQVSSFE